MLATKRVKRRGEKKYRKGREKRKFRVDEGKRGRRKGGKTLRRQEDRRTGGR